MSNPTANGEEPLEIDLRDPALAGFLAWVWPGLGHFYQRRYAKGMLFMFCILATYFFGLTLGEGKVVYANWNQEEHRWQYALQIGVGLPAAPAIVQAIAVKQRKGEPIGGYFMAPPKPAARGDDLRPERIKNTLPEWHSRLNVRFELGTLYTMIAGLLNILAIYDALAGPALSEPVSEPKRPPGEGDDKKK
jgi:uncharacterized protein DUF6677